MEPLTAVQLLNAWERGADQNPIERALTLLAAASPDEKRESLAQLPIGTRDAMLLTLRERTFGPQLVSVASCPNCGERLELAFDIAGIRSSGTRTGGESEEEAPIITSSVAGEMLAFRLPNSADLLAIGETRDVASARRALLESCLLGGSARHDHEPREWPEAFTDQVSARMAEADPQANVQVALACPNCGHAWQETFDIGSFFWTESDAWARRLLSEVHALASAYGWRETEILALGPRRRQAYLELIGA